MNVDPPTGTAAPTRLARKLGTADAVVIGLGAMSAQASSPPSRPRRAPPATAC